MTPAIRLLEVKRIVHQLHRYHHDPRAESFGEEAATKLGIAQERMFKTLVAAVDGEALVLAILPVAARLDLKKLAAAADCKRAELADPKVAEKATGYVVGGISPVGGRKVLPTFLDETAILFDTIFVSAGQRGLQIELSPRDLQSVSAATLTSLVKE